MTSLWAVLEIVVPVFVCSALGWGWVRSGRPYDRDLITSLIMNIGAPCLVFSGLVSLHVESELLLTMAVASLLAICSFTLLGIVALTLGRLPLHTYLAPLMFGNTGNLGLPICLFAFGDTGLALAVAFFAVTAVSHYTVGILVWSGRFSVAEVVRMPLPWAALAAVVVLVTGAPLPEWLPRTTELLGGFTIPLMLITLGVSLGELRLSDLPRTVALSLLRLAIGVATGFALAQALGLEGAARGVVIIQCATPVAVFNYLFAERFDRSPESVASLVVFSNALAFAVIPLLLHFVI